MNNDTNGASPAEALIKRGRLGLANRPCDCAQQLALLADAMAATAQGMSWVAQYAENVEPDMRKALQLHALELASAAGVAEGWANAIVRA